MPPTFHLWKRFRSLCEKSTAAQCECFICQGKGSSDGLAIIPVVKEKERIEKSKECNSLIDEENALGQTEK
jgi:hypothetical protein